jgi:hypothetical protein
MAWIHVAGASRIGPAVDGGRLVLMGGRRAIVTPSGEVWPERVRAPEALVDIHAAVSRAGRRVIVAAGPNGLYRFDDPLGAPVPLAHLGPVALVEAGAGKVTVEKLGQVPCGRPAPCNLVSVDLATGETTEGARPGIPEPPAPPLGRSPTLAWLEQTKTDPVAAAISNGVLLGDGRALAAAGTTLAIIALPEGRVLAMERLAADDSPLSECRPVRAGPALWVVCTISEHANRTVRPFRVTSFEPLRVEPLAWSKRHVAPRVVRGSRSGALFFYDTDGAVILTPAGAKPLSWPTADTRPEPGRWDEPTWIISSDDVLPRSDGRVAFVRVNRMDREIGVLSEGGSERIVARLPRDWKPLRILTEDDPGRLRVVGWSRGGAEIATVELDGGAIGMEPVRGLPCPREDCRWQIEMDERRGLALRLRVGMADTGPHGPETLQVQTTDVAVTRDGGRTWSPLKLPAAALGPAPMLAIPAVMPPGVRAIASDVGMLVGRMARIGWNERDDAAAGE